MDLFLVEIHASLRVGSIGQGWSWDFLIKKPASTNTTSVNTDMYILYFEIIISWGKTLTIDAKVAPAPRATNKAGNAQHINVDDDAKRVKIPIFDVLSLAFIIYIFLII